MEEPLAFCTLGMFIVDEIEYVNGKKSEQTVIGGAGTYAVLGARLAAGATNAHCIGWIVDEGSDFPANFKSILDSWQTRCVFRRDNSRLTTRAWNGYGPNEYRDFRYLTTKLRLDENSLTESQVLASAFHMVCSSQRCTMLVNGILARRQKLREDYPKPIFVWEPVPDLCSPEEFDSLCDAVSHVDVVSPNADELRAFFGLESEKMKQSEMVSRILRSKGGSLSNATLVVREGAHGSTAYIGTLEMHLPAFHQHSSRVKDVTGGGNAYLGALAMAMTGMVEPGMDCLGIFAPANIESSTILGGSKQLRVILLAVLHATIAASYAIEQTGQPVLSKTAVDSWNGENYQKRFFEFLKRLQSTKSWSECQINSGSDN